MCIHISLIINLNIYLLRILSFRVKYPINYCDHIYKKNIAGLLLHNFGFKKKGKTKWV